MKFRKFLFFLLKRPVYGFLFWFAGFALLVSGLVGSLLIFGAVLKEREYGFMEHAGQYSLALLWLVLSIGWGFLFREQKKYEKYLQNLIDAEFSKNPIICDIRYEGIPAQQDDFDIPKWNAGYDTHFKKQFKSWGTTSAETEVGSLLLAGLSQEEIAVVRKTTLKTVKNQATVVYEKAGVKNLKGLMSSFIQLLLPSPEDKPGKKDDPPSA